MLPQAYIWYVAADVTPFLPTAPTTIQPTEIPVAAECIVFAELGVAYHVAWKLYTCVTCEVGLKPTDIKGHMQTAHSMVVDKVHLLNTLELYPGQLPGGIPVSARLYPSLTLPYIRAFVDLQRH